jgi:site-specific DNA-methyltransferase (adenine-specific)
MLDSVSVLEQPKLLYKKEILLHKSIQLYQGDARIGDTFNSPFIDLIVTSPPYNVGMEYNSNNDELSYEQ